jgi:carboxymethylenebutenolidase
MGGAASFVANSGISFKAAISFYGGGIVPALLPRAEQQHGPVLFFWGGLDPLIPREQGRAVLDAMSAAKKPYMSVEFSDAGHGFFCDARASYKETAAKQAWEIAVRFLATNLKG